MRTSTPRPISVIKPLIVLNIIVFIFTSLSTQGNGYLLYAFCLNSFSIKQGEFWRLVTYMFTHASFSHIFFNMWGIYLFGRQLESLLGYSRFLVLYFVSGIVGGLFWLLCNWSTPYPVVGASGALFGLMVASAIAFPNMVITMIFPPVSMRLKHFVAIYMIIEVLLSFNSCSHVAHLAHLGGGLGGFLYMKRLRSQYIHPNTPSFWQNLAFLFRTLFATSKKETDEEIEVHECEPETDHERLTKILAKIAKEGYANLTDEELKFLADARRNAQKK